MTKGRVAPNITVAVTIYIVVLSVVICPVNGQCTGTVQADMVFILDASGSVGSSNFQTMLAFVQDLINDFDIGSDKVRVGVQKYSSDTNTEFNLNDYYDKTSMVTAVGNIAYTGGTTNTGGALEYLRTTMFTSGNGDRSAVTNIGVVLSDGISNDASYTATQASNARNAGITLFSIGIGSGIPLTELNEIATDPDSDHVFAVSGFSALDSIKASFQAQACPVVDGNWGSWGSWGSCSVTCGGGTKSRSRSCDDPAASNGGADCSGSGSDSTSCNSQDCPVDGNWGSWGSWGSCSVTCGGGTKSRSRGCDDPAASNGGADCSGSGSDSTSCNSQACPIDGNWGSWGSWGTCSVTCGGGTKSRSRSCDDPAASNGGADCSGSGSDSTSCNTHNCPIDGAWSSWQAWSACSVTCKAVGTRVRDRNCDAPAAQYGGADCPGNGNETESCDYTLTLCSPGNGWAPQVYETTSGTPVDGGFNSWGQWSACTRSCGAGVRVRNRQCNSPVPIFGGLECSGDYVQSETCNNVACSVNNSYVQTCSNSYFNCLNDTTTCLYYLKRCDCVKDCADGSDESVDYAGCAAEYSTCSSNHAGFFPELLLVGFLALYGTLLPYTWKECC